MKIIVEGKKPDERAEKKFSCEVCGCVFIASKAEYRLPDYFEAVHDGIEYACKCPCCGCAVYSYRTK